MAPRTAPVGSTTGALRGPGRSTGPARWTILDTIAELAPDERRARIALACMTGRGDAVTGGLAGKAGAAETAGLLGSHAVLPGLSPVKPGPPRLPPMGLVFDAAAGERPLVQRVWSASCDAATNFTSTAKGSSMIAIARTRDRLTVHLRGPETRATQLTCPAGWEFSVPSCSSVPICPCSRRPAWPA